MANHRKKEWADVTAGHHDLRSYAISTRDKSLIETVSDAVRHGQVLLAYQPVVSADNPGRVAYHEGLIRVLDSTGRIVPAKDFMEAIEPTEIGRVLDCIALEKGLRILAMHTDLRLAINMSARSIGYRRWLRTLARGLDADPTVGERLILEITESSAMLVPELVTGFMTEVAQRGISFALDDFGAGFTSFRYLKDFHFDILKIDGQFIQGIVQDTGSQVLAGALAMIGRQFDMLTVAESVERAEDAAYLAGIGIDCLQGYYFGAPTVKPAWLRREKRCASA